MSWEVDSEKQYKCPCGNGTYTVISRSNDWNQHDESWSMGCSDCHKEYTLHSFHNFRSMFDEYIWIKKSDLQNLATEKEQLRIQSNQLMAMFNERYAKQWKDLFSTIKTKKGVWEFLYNKFGLNSSLNKFYKFTSGHDGISRYVGNFVSTSNLQSVLHVLGVQDAEIESALVERRETEKRVSMLSNELLSNGYR